MNKLEEWYRHEHIGTLVIFMLVCLILLGILEKNFILTTEVALRDIAYKFGHLPEASIKEIAEGSNRIFAFNFVIISIILIISIFFYAVTLQPLVSSPLYSPRVPLEVIIRVLLISHLVTLAMLATKIIYYIFFVPKVDPSSYARFYPLSATALLNNTHLPKWVVGLLNSFNFFELVFTLSLGYGLSVALQNKRAFAVAVAVNLVLTTFFSLFGSMVSIG
jgi:hypothetical protein